MNFNLSNRINLKDNFYQYVNEHWLNKTTIPDDEQRWGSFNELHEENLLKIKSLLESDLVNSDNEFKKAGILYKQTIELFDQSDNNFGSPKEIITNFLTEIKQVSTVSDLNLFVHKFFTKYGLSTPISCYVYNDLKNSEKNILHIGTAGIGLPDRDYYFKKEHEDTVKEYKKFMKEYINLFELDLDTSNIFKIEEQLAESMYTNIEKRNPLLMNNPSSVEYLNKFYPEIEIDNFFKVLNIKPQEINLIKPNFIKKYVDLLNTYDIQKWKDYYTWIYIRKLGSYIHPITERKLFDFYSKTLSGTKKQKPIWKRSISKTESLVGMIVGKMFVKKHFDSNSKQKLEEIIQLVKKEIGKRIKSNTWMEPETKKKGIEKLSKMNFKIGYPDKWRQFGKLDVSSQNNYFQNVLNCLEFENDYDMSYLYKPKDPTLWFMNPQDVNAYYSPSFNEIVFPAGILQNPYFDIKNDIGVNFGGIVVIIGHEITHGFDDQGKKFDSNGNLNDWWTEIDTKRYNRELEKLKTLFSSYKIEDKFVNGELTLGENVADLGGLSISFACLKTYLELYPEENKIIDNFTQEQRFFLNYANIWKAKIRKKEALKRLVTDVHSPPLYRVNGILPNFTPFYETWNIKRGDGMYLDKNKRTKIW